MFERRMKKIREEAAAALKKAGSDMKKYYDKGRQDVPQYQVGDKVYLEGLNVTTDRPSKRLEDRRYGPFPIVAKVGERAYKLPVPAICAQIHPVFNTVLLRPARTPTSSIHGRATMSVGFGIERPATWEVEEVLDSRMRR